MRPLPDGPHRTPVTLTESSVLTSRRRSLVKELAEIRDHRDSPLMFMEGPRLVREVLESGSDIEILVWTPPAEAEEIFKPAHAKAKRKLQVTESVFKTISDVENPQGILAVARCRQWSWKDLVAQAPAPLLILDGIQDPGNVAALLRTAEASGAAGIVTTPGTAHLFSPKALRGAMGSTLRLPCLEHVPMVEIHSHVKQASYTLVAATMMSKSKKSVLYMNMDWKAPWAILLGQEGKGVSPDWEPLVKHYTSIPMQPPVESLNVAAAAAVILFESSRQRGNF
jgi:RNA methyltransferase, TrmH family